MLSVNTNIGALNAANALNQANRQVALSSERISTGLRVNSAKDDPGSLVLSNRLKAVIAGYGKASENINQGVAMAQVIDGALSSTSSILASMKTLAISSATSTTSAADRQVNQEQFAQYLSSIDSITSAASYNKHNLLDGSVSTLNLQTGYDTLGVTTMQLSAATTNHLGARATSSGNSNSALSSGDLKLNGIDIGASSAADDSTSVAADGAGSAIAKVAAINRKLSETQVFATVETNTVSGTAMSAPIGAITGTVAINNKNIDVSLTGDTAQNRLAVTQAVNAELLSSGIKAVDSGTDAGGVELSATDGRTITIAYGGTVSDSYTGLGTSGTHVSEFRLESLSGSSIKIAGNDPSKAGLDSATTQTSMLAGLDISTQSGGQGGMSLLDSAIDQVSRYQSRVGAQLNRFEIQSDFAGQMQTTATESYGHINDADLAKETVHLASAQIIQNAAAAMLAQANVSQDIVKYLLKSSGN